MFCQKCGKENEDNAKFCSACGSSLHSDTTKSAEQKAQEIKEKSKESASTLFYLIKPLLKVKVIVPLMVALFTVIFWSDMVMAYDDYQYEKKKLVREKKETFTDSSTGLMWQDSSNLRTRIKWKEAYAYCENSTYAGYEDWRMPTLNELNSIVDKNNMPAIKSGFSYVAHNNFYPSDAYWSSSKYDNSDVIKSVIAFEDGAYFGGTMYEDKNYIRCVRTK